MKKVSILGVGWLGEALFKRLVKDGQYHVVGSSRNPEKRERLEQYAAELGGQGDIFQISLPDQLQPAADFWSCDVLVITIPPGRRREQVAERYPAEILRVIDLAKQRNIKHLIYTSSTGVYGQQNGVVVEDSELQPSTESAKAVANVEAILKQAGLPVTILRLAGLFGPNRHPGRWFAGRPKLENADAPVNLVYQADVVQAIQLVIKKPPKAIEVYNICAASHPRKGDFYPKAIQDYGGEIPELLPGGGDGKTVDTQKIRKRLGWQPVNDGLNYFN